MEYCIVNAPQTVANPIKINVPSSKSESNRALLLKYLYNPQMVVENLSIANDTRLMLQCLNSTDTMINAHDAGTVYRFLTAFLAIQSQERILQGSERMKERPIGLLVDALRQIGADIQYLEKEGFPPLKFGKFNYNGSEQISIQGNISSQYISALMMIGAKLPKGLTINLTTELSSRPYAEMTATMMRNMGLNVNMGEHTIKVESSNKISLDTFIVEGDWSGAGYWYLTALALKTPISVFTLKTDSLQGDSGIVKLSEKFGLQTEFIENGVVISPTNNASKRFEFDFSDMPDMAQTVFAMCALTQTELDFTGVHSLKIKESDRVVAMQTELAKFGVIITENNNNSGTLRFNDQPQLPDLIEISTYKDHRMAMAIAPLSVIRPLKILDPKVVIKSYPTYWDDLQLAGFQVTFG